MKECKILIVDDADNLALLLESRLEAANYEVRTAGCAAEAYQTFLTFKPDLVLTDIGIGEENGLDLIKRIRDRCGSVKTIYMTGDLARYRSVLVEEKILHHAAVLAKPFSTNELISAVSAQASY
jgi:two-component system response regulator AtoC